MRRNGITNAQLAAALAELRHTDLFAVSDSGLPAPRHVPVIDLAVTYGMPEFLPVLELIHAEVETEAAWASEPVAAQNPTVYAALQQNWSVELLAHEEFKERIGDCRFVVRTGEATPYANVLLRAGVPWID